MTHVYTSKNTWRCCLRRMSFVVVVFIKKNLLLTLTSIFIGGMGKTGSSGKLQKEPSILIMVS
jgi:hypothetical protein